MLVQPSSEILHPRVCRQYILHFCIRLQCLRKVFKTEKTMIKILTYQSDSQLETFSDDIFAVLWVFYQIGTNWKEFLIQLRVLIMKNLRPIIGIFSPLLSFTSPMFIRPVSDIKCQASKQQLTAINSTCKQLKMNSIVVLFLSFPWYQFLAR